MNERDVDRVIALLLDRLGQSRADFQLEDVQRAEGKKAVVLRWERNGYPIWTVQVEDEAVRRSD